MSIDVLHTMNDQPIGSVREDSLNRASFAKSIANTIIELKKEAGFTLSVEGPWGHGKSSVLYMVKEALETALEKDGKQPIFIDFNPWLIGNCEQLTRQLLGKISSALGMVDNSKEALKAAKQLKAYATLFDAMSLVPVLQPFSSVIAKVFKTVGKTSEDIAKLKERDLEANKEEINKTLAGLDRPVVIFIDDLDRVTPKEAFEVLRLVKAVADFTNVTYVLAFDPNYLSQVLNSNHIANSHEYLDKLVQLRLSLPNIGPNIHSKLLLQDIKALALETRYFNPRDKGRFQHLLNEHFIWLIESTRDRKRVVNRFSFLVAELRKRVALSDLFALSLLAIKEPSLYQLIKRRPELFLKSDLQGNTHNEHEAYAGTREIHPIIKKEVDACSSPHRVQKLLAELFPVLSDGFDIYDKPDQSGKVADYFRLFIALHYTLPPGCFDDAEIDEILTDSDRAEQVTAIAINAGTYGRLLEQLKIRATKKTPLTIDSFLSVVKTYLCSDLTKADNMLEAGILFHPFKNETSEFAKFFLVEVANPSEGLQELAGCPELAPIFDALYTWVTQTGTGIQITDKNALVKAYGNSVKKCFADGQYKDTGLEASMLKFWSQVDPTVAAEYFQVMVKNDPKPVLRVAQMFYHVTDEHEYQGLGIKLRVSWFWDIVERKGFTERFKAAKAELSPNHIATLESLTGSGFKAFVSNPEMPGLTDVTDN